MPLASIYSVVVSPSPPVAAGQPVAVTITLRNVSGEAGYLGCTAYYLLGGQPVSLHPVPDYGWADPWSVYQFSVEFTMPGSSIDLVVYGWHWDTSQAAWIQDAAQTVSIAVSTPAPSGRFYPPHYYWYPGLPDWALLYPDSPPSVPGGTEFHLALNWLNNGSVSVRGHVDLTVTRPDGSQMVPPAVLNQDNVAAPGSGWGVQFAPITLDQAGSWTARAVLSGEAA
jgi:hypothetical protein